MSIMLSLAVIIWLFFNLPIISSSLREILTIWTEQGKNNEPEMKKIDVASNFDETKYRKWRSLFSMLHSLKY